MYLRFTDLHPPSMPWGKSQKTDCGSRSLLNSPHTPGCSSSYLVKYCSADWFIILKLQRTLASCFGEMYRHSENCLFSYAVKSESFSEEMR